LPPQLSQRIGLMNLSCFTSMECFSIPPRPVSCVRVRCLLLR
jgi:hypothetical protein